MNFKKTTSIIVLVLIALLPVTEAINMTGIRVTDVTDTTAVVRWDTDQDADSVVRYGADKNGGFISQSPIFTRQHSVPLQQLNKSTTYQMSVQSTAASSSAEDTNNGQLYSFTTVAQDTTPPRIDVNLPGITNKRRIDVVGETEVGVDLLLFQDNVLRRSYVTSNGLIEFLDIPLASGQTNSLRIDARDTAGNTNTRTYSIFADVVAPKITFDALPSVTSEDKITVKGTISEESHIVISANNNSVLEQDGTTFTAEIQLEEGENVIVITATDKAGNEDRKEHTISRDSEPPEVIEAKPLDDNPFYYEGRATDTIRGKTEPGARVHLLIGGRTGASVAIGQGGGASAAFNPAGTGREPTLKEVIDNAQFETTADSNGSFKFEDVNFQHPLGAEDLTPRQVEPGLEGLTGQQQRADLEDQTRAIPVYIAVVDDVGLGTVRTYSIDLGNCFSGFFDFSLQTLPAYQTPGLLSPQRLDAGTEIVSFVMNINYSGRAGNNLRNPRAERKDDDFYEITNVQLEPTCRRNDPFINRDPSYQYACQMMKGRPAIARAIDPLQTNWYFRYNLGASDKFTKFDEQFWKSLANNELKFPFKVTVQYREKLTGRDEQDKTQTLCRDVSYFVDVPIDPRKVLPDGLLRESQKAINETLQAIDKVLPVLEDVIKYVGIGCMGSFGLRTIVQILRRFTQKWEYATCKVVDIAKGKEDKCPIKDESQLEACFFIKGDTDKVPYPQAVPSRSTKCQGIKGTAPGQQWPMDIKAHDKMKNEFDDTISLWNMEASIYVAYRALCDRIFCHASPAGWTQKEEIADIQQQVFAQQQCAAEGASSGRVLRKIDNCYNELAERQKIIDKVVVTRESLTKQQDTCYEYYGAIYKVDDETGCGKDPPIALLTRIDNRKEVRSSGGIPDIVTPSLCAKRVGNTLYTADYRNCETKEKDVQNVCGSGWIPHCVTAEQAKNQKVSWYPFGPTKDCWDARGAKAVGSQCYCEKNTKGAATKQKAEIETKGAAYAGTELKEKWPWNYREAQLYRTSGGGAGIYYPEERYYSGRDQTAAFGLDYALDPIFNTKTPTVDPHNQHIGAIQTVCLSGIRGRLVMLKNILTGMNNCLKQIQTTGKADGGVCKELFSQFVCNLTYQIFTAVQNQCVAQPFTPAIKNEQPGVFDALDFASESVTETLDDTSRELNEEYGNAALNQYFEGGTQALMKKVCLAAFGIDTGFDFEGFIDAAYSTPMASSVGVFSIHGMRGTRQFMSFNPQNFNSVYEYRAAWNIVAGCPLESYRVDLVAVTQNDDRSHSSQFDSRANAGSNIDCSAVNNNEPIDSTNGCDNWQGSKEQVQSFSPGARVEQGGYIDQSKSLVVESPYRYDHIKITLFADKRQDVDKCFPKENRQGDAAVYYFPIYDETAKDLAQCSVTAADGKFICTLGELSSLSQTFIEDVTCFDPRTSEYRRCDRITLTLADGDPIKAKVSVFSTGQDKVCLDTFIKTQNAGNIPLPRQGFIEVPGIGRPGSIPIEVNLLPAIKEMHFRGTTGQGISLRDTVTQISRCGFIEAEGDPDPNKKVNGQAELRFTKDASGNIGVIIPSGVIVLPDSKFEIAGGKLAKKDKTGVTLNDLDEVTYRINGFGVKNVIPRFETDNQVICTFQTFRPQTTGSNAPSEQQWTLHTELYYPDETGQCSEGSSPAAPVSRTAFETKKLIPIKVRDTKTETALVVAYQKGKQFYDQANRGTPNQRYPLYQSAVTEFGRVLSSSPAVEGSREEFLAYWWSIAALANMIALKEKSEPSTAEKDKNNLLSFTKTLASRLQIQKVQDNKVLLSSTEIQLAAHYAADLEKRFGGSELSVQVAKIEAKVDGPCDECATMEREWAVLVPLLKIKHPTEKLPSGEEPTVGKPYYWDVKAGTHSDKPVHQGRAGTAAPVTLTDVELSKEIKFCRNKSFFSISCVGDEHFFKFDKSKGGWQWKTGKEEYKTIATGMALPVMDQVYKEIIVKIQSNPENYEHGITAIVQKANEISTSYIQVGDKKFPHDVGIAEVYDAAKSDTQLF